MPQMSRPNDWFAGMAPGAGFKSRSRLQYKKPGEVVNSCAANRPPWHNAITHKGPSAVGAQLTGLMTEQTKSEPFDSAQKAFVWSRSGVPSGGFVRHRSRNAHEQMAERIKNGNEQK